jgi:hypothetical protein
MSATRRDRLKKRRSGFLGRSISNGLAEIAA